MNSVKLLARIACDYLNVLGELVPYGSPHSAYIITPTFTKKSGVGALSIKSDDPSKDEDGNSRNNQSTKPKRSQEQGQNSNQAKSEKDSSKSKNTQTGTRKQCDKGLNLLGGYAGRVMVGDRR